MNKKGSFWELLFSKKNDKTNNSDDDWTERCDECGELFEDCECNCDDEDCHNEGGWQ